MNKSIKKMILALIFLIIVIAFLVFVNLENKKRQAQLFQLKDNIETLKNLPIEAEIEKRMRTLENKKNETSIYLLGKDEPIAFIETIESLSKDYGVNALVENAESIRFGENNGFGGAITLSVSVFGNISDIRNFLFALENYNKEIIIPSVRFSRNGLQPNAEWQAVFNVIGKTE